LLVCWFSEVPMPASKSQGAKLTFVLSAAWTPQIRRAMRSWSCFSLAGQMFVNVWPARLVLFVCVALQRHLHSPVPRPSTLLVFDRLQYAKTYASSFWGAEGLEQGYIYILPIEVPHMAISRVATSFTVLYYDSMPKQQRTSNRPFCQTTITLVGHVAFSFGFCPLTDQFQFHSSVVSC